MVEARTLEAPPTLFDEVAAILKKSDCGFSLLSSESVNRGVRRMDSACYDVTRGHASVQLLMERRLGNPTMFISVIPTRKSIWHRDLASDRLAEHIVEWLVANGASSFA
jgi:hypothetical protein